MRFVSAFALCAALAFGEPGLARAQDARPGIGPSTERPVGRQFEWPAGVVPPDRFQGYSENDCRRRPEEPTDEVRGLETYVRICLALYNTTSAPIRVDLPAGLLFVSVDDETQNGLLINLETFEIPPGDEPYFAKLYLWCANANRSPSGYMDEYETGPVTEDRKILDVINRLAGRPLTQEDVRFVQAVIWSATDDKELADYEQAWLHGGAQ